VVAILGERTGTLAVPAIDLAISPLRILLSGSLLFGILLILVTPPLRGPDETAHFLRAYGIAHGDFIPSTRDSQGRKGVFLPARLYEGFNHFESVREKSKEGGYGPVFRAYFGHRPTADPDAPPVFVPYGGSEGYSPVAYVPQSAAALVARMLDLDFVATQYLMRLAGLIAITGLLALAIALVPALAWPLVVIAMLPAALYGRSVINADATALAGAMMVIALWLRGMLHPQPGGAGRQSFWMTLGALTKPPNVTFVMLELFAPPERSKQRWRTLALTALPAIAVALLWSVASGSDTASWRMVEITGHEPSAYDPLGRILYLLRNPLHFPISVFHALREKDLIELWNQVIGVLGLFDTVLHAWVYPTLTATLLASFVGRIPSTPAIRLRLALGAAATTLCYAIVVYFICYLVFTPLDADSVWGVQGRYFVPILPLVAIVVAALANRAPVPWLSAALAVFAATLSGVASIVAIIDVDWT
jgi:uncharacterized membrane protein